MLLATDNLVNNEACWGCQSSAPLDNGFRFVPYSQLIGSSFQPRSDTPGQRVRIGKGVKSFMYDDLELSTFKMCALCLKAKQTELRPAL
jgi:hypothetical protein